MRNLLITLIFLIISGCVHAQIKAAPADVKEILMHNAVAGLGGGTDADVKVVFEAGRWQSYLIHKSSKLRYKGANYDSTLNRHIATLSPALVNNFLNGLAIIKPAIVENTFGIKAAGLIAELERNAKSPITKTLAFEKLITQNVINTAIAKIVAPMNVLDDYESCEVTVITQNNEKIKLTTTALCATKLPWMIDDHPTYDMAINNLVVAALGKEDIPNKNSLNIKSLKEAIFKYIDASHPGSNPIGTFMWNNYYPEVLKPLTQHFTISKNYWSWGNVYLCQLRTKSMPDNVMLEGRIDMTRKEDIDMIINYSTLIDSYLMKDNFVFKYYNNRPGTHLYFSFNTGQSPYPSLQYLEKKLPGLAIIDSTRVINFLVVAPDESSHWIIFPDNTTLLTQHSVSTPDKEAAPIFPPSPVKNWIQLFNSYYVFDGAGKVLSQGTGFN